MGKCTGGALPQYNSVSNTAFMEEKEKYGKACFKAVRTTADATRLEILARIWGADF